MPSKTEEYLALAQQTAKELTRYWENWTDYLTTASRLYKYSFADQLMIYAQRPDATACASFDIWNNRMNRYVRRGSKGIALLDQSSSVPRLHYVFDVSDTGVRRNSRDPEVWQLGPDLVQPVSEMIAREYGVYHERLSQQISDLTGKLVDSYWDNNSNDILDIVDGSFLMDYDEAGQEFQFKSAAAISILYTVLERCGLEPDGHFDRDDFQAIFSFSSPAAVYALGTAVSEYVANEPKVSFRNGQFIVTDGQHTIEGRILRNGGKDLPILCKVYTGMTVEQEALLFAEQNGFSAPLTAGIKLRAKVVGGDAISKAFLTATNRVGLSLNYDSQQLTDYRIGCVGTAFRLYKQMGEPLYCETMRLIVAAWEGKPDSFRASVLKGMMHFVELYHGEFSEERLLRALRNIHPVDIYRIGQDDPAKLRGWKKYVFPIYTAYNGKCRKDALPMKF